MNEFAFNGNKVLLDDRLREFERIRLTPEFIVYHQFLNQLRLPHEKWSYARKEDWTGLVERNLELEELDAIFFKELDYSKLVSPLRLYTYFLLQEYLGNGLNFSGLGIVRSRKSHFVYLDTSFQIKTMKQHTFGSNDLSRFLVRRAKKKELHAVHETFFVLINSHFRSKLMNALTLYQSETSDSVAKTDMIDVLLNPNRLEALKTFSLDQIERL